MNLEPMTIPDLAGPVILHPKRLGERMRATVGREVVMGFDGWFRLPTAYGDTTKAYLRRGWFDPYPRLEVDGVLYRTGPAAPLALRLAMLAPLLLVLVGGLLGAAIGAAGVLVGFVVVRSTMVVSAKVLLLLAVFGTAFGVLHGVS